MALLDRLGAWWEQRSAALEAKALPPYPDYSVIYVPPLIHGPGATEILAGGFRRDGNSAVYACLAALAAGFTEAPARVYRVTGQQDRTELPAHPLQALLDRPNPYWSSLELWSWVQWVKHCDGDAYVRKLRAGDGTRGNVVELWPISPTRIELRSTATQFISAYRYHYAAGKWEDIDPANMLHFRLGVDDRDHRHGLGPLKRLARELGADERASIWAESLLRNGAVPGLILKQKGLLSLEQAEQAKVKLRSIFGGENVGDVGVIDQDGDLAQFGFNPEQMQLTALHRVPEERISAVLRVPAIVAGLGAGLDRSTYANVKEAREMFTESTLSPLWAQDAAKLQSQLVPDFARGGDIEVGFDTGAVRALQEDLNAKGTRVEGLLKAGAITVDEARSAMGFDPLPQKQGEIFYVSSTVTPTPAAELATPPEPAPVPAPLRALPAAGAATRRDREAKARGLSVPFARLRQRTEPKLTTAVADFLRDQQARVLSRLLSTQAGRTAWQTKAADDLVPFTEDDLLRALLEPWYADILTETVGATQAALGVAFGVPDYAALQYLRDAGRNIVGISDTTRQAVRDALVAGAREAEGVDGIAKRIRALPEFDRKRARVVARTELGNSQIEASFTSYKQSGAVAGVRVLDGDYDEECAHRNGQVFSLAAAHGEPRLLHPNCTAAWLPVTDAAEVEGAA